MRVAVFCASANEVEPCYFREAGRLGKRIGELGWQLIYGGTNIGLMREVADATIRQGGEVTGIIPECIRDRGVAAGGLKQLIVAPDMKERKHLLREHADAFIALPGGWGILEEITEVITLKQLGQHNKPIVFFRFCKTANPVFQFRNASSCFCTDPNRMFLRRGNRIKTVRFVADMKIWNSPRRKQR